MPDAKFARVELSTEDNATPTYRNRVSGVVRDAGGFPIKGATVTVSGDGSTLYSEKTLTSTTTNPATTDGNGRFEFYLPIGDYTLTYAATTRTLTYTTDAIKVEDGPLAQSSQSGSSGAVTLISRTVVGAGGAANVDLTGIPATFENLEVVVVARDDAVVTNHSLLVRLNNDSGANYNWQRSGSFDGNNGNNSEGVGQTSATVGDVLGASAPAGAASTTRMILAGYARTVFNKTIQAFSGGHYGVGQSLFYQMFNEWASTAAVNRITITPTSGNFVQGTVVTLFGITGSGNDLGN